MLQQRFVEGLHVALLTVLNQAMQRAEPPGGSRRARLQAVSQLLWVKISQNSTAERPQACIASTISQHSYIFLSSSAAPSLSHF